jgi:hypothetical protein
VCAGGCAAEADAVVAALAVVCAISGEHGQAHSRATTKADEVFRRARSTDRLQGEKMKIRQKFDSPTQIVLEAAKNIYHYK